jgi:hypothetical protein
MTAVGRFLKPAVKACAEENILVPEKLLQRGLLRMKSFLHGTSLRVAR